MSKRKKKGKGRGGVMLGVLCGVLTMLVLISAAALILHKNNALADYIGVTVIAINIISSIICGCMAAGNVGNKRLARGVLAGAVYFLLMLILAACIDADNIKLISVCEMGTMCLVGSAVGSALNLCKSNKKLRKKVTM